MLLPKKLLNHFSAPICPRSVMLIKWGTLVIFAQLGYIIFDLLYGNHENYLYMLSIYRQCVSIIWAEPVILLIGAFLLDIFDKETQSSR